MKYGQFCPISKAAEVLGDKWTLLIIREIMMGGNRFNVLQRGLNSISPTVLTKRLNDLCDEGIVIKKKIQGQKGFEYYLTECGRELFPMLEQMGKWGMRWARGGMPDEDLDVELLMLYMERSVNPVKLFESETVVHFHFNDISEFNNWWLVVKDNEVDACITNPGKDVDVHIHTDLRTMIAAWMGDTSYKKAEAEGRMKLMGNKALTQSLSSWIKDATFAGIPPAEGIKYV